MTEAIEREATRTAGSGRPAAVASAHRQRLTELYAAGANAPVWFAPQGARPAVAAAFAEFGAAAARGLEPTDYGIERLAGDVARAGAGDRTAQAIAQADVALTAAMLHFLGDLRDGRTPPRAVEPHWRSHADDPALGAGLREAVAADRLAAMIDAAEPSFPVYGRLKRMLARYRTLAEGTLPTLPALPPGRPKIGPGESYEGVGALHDRLVLLGDLPGDAARPSDDRYSTVLAAAVNRFQDRHGLAADGVLGRETLAQLGVPLRHRVDQITLSLERLRWLPDFPPGPLIAVNIPSFRLWAFADVRSADRPALAMPVIVGRAMRTETPVFIGDMLRVEFSPYWNVPPSILRHEVLPTLRRDPSYLQREGMELVSTGGDGATSTAVDAATLAALESGALRVRQRPGARNALAGVKFVLPNTMDIYLHGTPAAALFGPVRRDFSHGCIRVADPAALAGFVLRGQPEWTAARIRAAMASGRMTTVNLAAAIPVVVFYTTAMVGADDRALFLPDIYGHDRRLEAALRAPRAGARPRTRRRGGSATVTSAGRVRCRGGRSASPGSSRRRRPAATALRRADPPARRREGGRRSRAPRGEGCA